MPKMFYIFVDWEIYYEGEPIKWGNSFIDAIGDMFELQDKIRKGIALRHGADPSMIRFRQFNRV